MISYWRQKLGPSETVTPEAIERGLRAGHWEAAMSLALFSLIGGAFLTGWALQLGASMTYIGLLNAAGAAALVVQLPGAWISSRWPERKKLWTITQIPGRALWMLIPLLPLVMTTPTHARGWALVLIYLSFVLMNISGPAWSSWLRDFVPEDRMGRHLGTRVATGLVAGGVVGLLGGVLVDRIKGDTPHMLFIYGTLFGVGALVGLLGVLFALRQPEPRAEADPRSFFSLVAAPLADTNFRRFLHFMLAWNLAAFLAAPFGTAYILNRLHMDMRWAVGLGVLIQLVMALFMPMWGRLTDRFTSKSVMSIVCPLSLLTYPAWILAGNVQSDFMRIGLLVALHVIGGLAAGGMIVASSNLLMKFAPRGRAAAYAGLNASAMGVAAMISPWLGGQLADRLADVEFAFTLSLTTPQLHKVLPMVHIVGIDYAFLAALIGGLYGWHRLLAVKEVGEVEELIILGALVTEFWTGIRLVQRRATRGIKHITITPWNRLKGL